MTENPDLQIGDLAPDFDLPTDGGGRVSLSDLRGSLQGNDKLDEMLFEAVTNTEKRDTLRAEMGTEGGK